MVGQPLPRRTCRTYRAKRLEFDQMSITDQAELKPRLAERCIRAGIDETDNYQTWLRSVPADQYVARSLQRQQRFSNLSPAEQGASVTAWQRHRARYGLPHPLTDAHGALQAGTTGPEQSSVTPESEQHVLLPRGDVTRDVEFTERQGTLLPEG